MLVSWWRTPKISQRSSTIQMVIMKSSSLGPGADGSGVWSFWKTCQQSKAKPQKVYTVIFRNKNLAPGQASLLCCCVHKACDMHLGHLGDRAKYITHKQIHTNTSRANKPCRRGWEHVLRKTNMRWRVHDTFVNSLRTYNIANIKSIHGRLKGMDPERC